jgi:hypothetical protein
VDVILVAATDYTPTELIALALANTNAAKMISVFLDPESLSQKREQ